MIIGFAIAMVLSITPLSTKFLADKQFWAAILAAPIVWILLYFYTDALIAKQEFNPIYLAGALGL
jgi:hypothetical protein